MQTDDKSLKLFVCKAREHEVEFMIWRFCFVPVDAKIHFLRISNQAGWYSGAHLTSTVTGLDAFWIEKPH